MIAIGKAPVTIFTMDRLNERLLYLMAYYYALHMTYPKCISTLQYCQHCRQRYFKIQFMSRIWLLLQTSHWWVEDIQWVTPFVILPVLKLSKKVDVKKKVKYSHLLAESNITFFYFLLAHLASSFEFYWIFVFFHWPVHKINFFFPNKTMFISWFFFYILVS